MSDRPIMTKIAQSLPATVPFVGPEAQERQRGKPFVARVGANENGFGPSPKVISAMNSESRNAWKYADPDNHDLKQALASHVSVSPENIAVGEGIDALLGHAVRLYADSSTTVVTSLGAYPTFNYHVAGYGARLVTVPYRDDREDLGGLLDLVRQHAACMVYLSNPDNPMGTWWAGEAIQQFIEALPTSTVLILDEAYAEMASSDAIPAIDVSRPNVLRMRTFSKAYGLAGLRCGYAIGESESIAAFNKVCNYYSINRMAQAGALAALADQTYLGNVLKKISEARERIAAIARSNGLLPLPSATNFVTIDCQRDGDFALRLLGELLGRGVFVRKPMSPGEDRCIRITVAPDPELDTVEEILPAALAAAEN